MADDSPQTYLDGGSLLSPDDDATSSPLGYLYQPSPLQQPGSDARFRSVTSAISAGSATSVTCPMPAGLETGDLLVAAHAIGSSSDTVTFPGGWTVQRETGATGVGDSFGWKVATSSEPSLVVTSGSARNHGLIVAAYANVDTSNPVIASASSVQATAVTVHTSPGAYAGGGILEVTFVCDHIAGSQVETNAWTPETGIIRRAQAFPAQNGFQGTTVGFGDAGVVTSAGAIPERDWTSANGKAANGSAWSIALNSLGGLPSPITPTAPIRVVGLDRIRLQTANATSVRVKIGTDAAFTADVVYTSAQIPDTQSNSTHVVTGLGLTPGVRYYWRAALTDTDGTELVDSYPIGRFRVPPTGQYTFGFSAGSCTNAADSDAMTAAAAWGDDLFIHMGDLWYADGSGVNVDNYRVKMGAKLSVSTAPKHAGVFSSRVSVFTPSDHDFGMINNGYGEDGTGSRDIYNQVYRELIPTVPVPATTGIYHTFSWGRVRFIVTDCRSFMVNPADTDNASKTKLGAVQKQWVKDTITAAAEPLIVLVGDVPWTGPAVAGDDAWDGYTTERTELVDFFDLQVEKNIVYINGDQHAVAGDDGTNGFGVVSYCCAPLNNTASQKTPYSTGLYPASGSATVQQYGRFIITDVGSTITISWIGYSSDNTVRKQLNTTFTVGPYIETPSDTFLAGGLLDEGDEAGSPLGYLYQPSLFQVSDVVAGGDATVTPATVAATTSIDAPTVSAGASLTVVTVNAVATVGAPAVSAGAGVSPATVAAVASVGSPTVSAGGTVAPATVAATATVGAPVVGISYTVTPATVQAVATVGSPVVSAGGSVNITPATVQAVASVGAPVISAGAAVTPATVAAVATVGVTAPHAGATVAPTTVAAVSTVGAPAVSAGANVAPATVAGVATVGTPVVSAGGSANVSPATVAAVVTVGTPVPHAGASVTPATVQAVATVGALVVAVHVTITPATITAVTTIGAPTVRAGATVIASTVAGVVTIGAPTVVVVGPVTAGTSASTFPSGPGSLTSALSSPASAPLGAAGPSSRGGA